MGSRGGQEGIYRSSVDARCVVQYVRGTNVQNASSQRCEHPGFPGASSVCSVLVSWTYPSPAQGTGVHCGTAKGSLGFHSSGPMTVKARISDVSTFKRGSRGGLEGPGRVTRIPAQAPTADQSLPTGLLVRREGV
eukprot:1178197-Prorocentrum_minimum.AAC.1